MSSLTSYLAKKGAVGPMKLQKALLNQAINGGTIGMSLIEVGAIDEDSLVEMTGKFYHLDTVATAACLEADPEASGSLSRTRCEDLLIVALRQEKDKLVIACVEPPGRTALKLLEREVGKSVELVVASPLAVELSLAVHHDLPLDPRAAAILRGREVLGLGDVDESVAERVSEILAGAGEKPGQEDGQEPVDDDDWSWEDDDEDDEPVRDARDSVVGKYIIVNRIGARPRRPSIRTHRPAEVEAEETTDRVERSEETMSPEITFTDGSMKASEDSRPQRPSSVPPPPHRSRPPVTPDSGPPPAILKEVIEEYLEGDLKPPPHVSEDRLKKKTATPARQRQDVRVVRTVSVTPTPDVAPLPEAEQMPPARKVSSKTMPGVAVLEDMQRAPDGAVQGYAVEVPELASLSEVLENIEGSNRAGDIADAVHHYALQFFDFVLMLRYSRGRFELTAASSRGWAWPVDQLPLKFLGYDQLPRAIQKLGQPYLGPLDPDGRIAEIIEAVARPMPPSAIMFPIAIKGRAIVVIYGDNGERSSNFDDVKDLFHATCVATNRLAALLEERKR